MVSTFQLSWPHTLRIRNVRSASPQHHKFAKLPKSWQCHFSPVFIQSALESSGPIQQLVLVIIFVHLKIFWEGWGWHKKKDANDFQKHFIQVFGSTHYAKWSNCELIGAIIRVKQLSWQMHRAHLSLMMTSKAG